MSTTTTRTTRAACPSAFAFGYRLDKVTVKGEINVIAKGVRNLSAKRINKCLGVVNRTLLALSPIVVWRFNGWYYGQSQLHNDNQIVRGNTSNE